MYKSQKLVFSRRLTANEVKKIEALVSDAPGVFITDVKTHSVELFVEFNTPHGFTQSYNNVVNDIYRDFNIGNAMQLDGEGFLLVFKSTESLQSDEMKQHGANLAQGMFK